MYRKALRNGKEKVFNIRIMVVGPYDVGKTTLTKRLLGKYVNICDRQSTEGIDVQTECCKVSLATREWITQEQNAEQNFNLQRLVKLLNGQVQQKSNDKKQLPKEMETHVFTAKQDKGHAQHDLSVRAKQDTDEEDIPTLSQPVEFQIAILSPEASSGVAKESKKKDAVMEILQLVNANSDKLEKSMEEYAKLGIWDFAGQFAFYTTHQTFLSYRAVYLLVLDLSQQITALIKDECFIDTSGLKQCQVQETIDTWMNLIHSCTPASQPGIPAVILVGTHVDKIPKTYRDELCERYFREIRSYLKDKPTRFHLVDEDFAIDNTVVDSRLVALKQKIVEVASQQPYWGEEVPARWILLERELMRLKAAGIKVIPRTLLEAFNQAEDVPIPTEELDLFLKFQNDIGTILYFSIEALKDKIVLVPQWMIDALKSLITAEMFVLRNVPAVADKWDMFNKSGKLYPELIDAIWTKEKYPDLHDNKEHILLLMEHLNIIARPRCFSEDGSEIKVDNYFLAPCMLKEKTPESIMFPKPDAEMKSSSSVLCYNFVEKFLPSPIFHRLLATCVSRWPIAQTKSENQIFCGCCIFSLDLHHRLTVLFREYIIFVQVFRFGTTEMTPSSKLCIEVQEFVTKTLTSIIGYLGHSLKFEMSVQCPKSVGYGVDCLIPVADLQGNVDVPCHFHDIHVIRSQDVLKFWFQEEEPSDAGWSLESLPVQGEPEESRKGNLKAETDQTEAVFIHQKLVELAKSIGIIKTPCGSGTGFRVGPNYVMTARHVVEPIMKKVPFPQQQQPQLLGQHQLSDANVFIDFCYEWNSLPSDPNNIYYFEPEIVYDSVYLDTVILKLKPDIKPYPPPLTRFTDITQDKNHGYFIGHSQASIKKTDKYQIVTLTKSVIDNAKKWSMDFVNEDGYPGIENQHRVLFHCSFEKGASGSPGFRINPGDGQAYVELMLLCGYPTWLYENYQGNTRGIPNHFLVEQGVSMRSINDDVKARDELLCNTVFGTS